VPPVRKVPELSGFLRRLRGGSQPVLAIASDGACYVVKFSNQPQGPNVLFNESIGAELYRLAKLFVAAWTPLKITQRFADENRGCWIETEHGFEPPRAGLCFGSYYLGGCKGLPLFELLPENWYARIRNRDEFWLAWLLDLCASHTDNRQAVFCKGLDGKYSAFFVDHGHMFGGPRGQDRGSVALPAYLDRRIYPLLTSTDAERLSRRVVTTDFDRLWNEAQALPEEWRTATALDRLAEALETLSRLRSIESVLGTLILQQHQADMSIQNGRPNRRKPAYSVMCSRLEPVINFGSAS